MIYEILNGVAGGVTGLLLLYAGYAMLCVGRSLVTHSTEGSSREMTQRKKWRAVLWAISIAAILAAVVTVPRSGGCFYLLDEPDVSEISELARPDKSIEAFCRVFVFCFVAMCVGISKSDGR